MAKSRVTFPDGTVVEIAKDTPPEQIQAILATLKQAAQPSSSGEVEQTGKVIETTLSAEEIWEHGSKKEKLALFVRNHFMPSDWFTSIMVRDQQIEFVKNLIFGESSAIATYLNRLTEDDLLIKKKLRRMSYQLTDKIMEEYPPLQFEEMEALLHSSIK